MQSKNKLHLYNWKDSIYSLFMIEFLRATEPRREPIGIQLYLENEQIEEVIFFSEGSIDIGIRHKGKYGLLCEKQKNIVIGDHDCTFDHLSNFTYLTREECHGIFVRKRHWKELLEKYSDIGK